MIVGFGITDGNVLKAAKDLIGTLLDKPEVKNGKTRVTVLKIDQNWKPKVRLRFSLIREMCPKYEQN